MTNEISLSYDGNDGETIRITASPSMMHPESCTFQISVPLYEDNSSHFSSKESSMGSPLINQIFDLSNIADIVVTHASLTVTIANEASWDDYIPKIGSVVHSVLLSGSPAISEEVSKSQLTPEQIEERVQNVLDTVINPSIAAHGGVVSILDVTNNTVFLEFGGGCQGCGMINVTLKYGVEKSIREQVPEIGEILDTTDHASGRNPYYAPSAK